MVKIMDLVEEACLLSEAQYYNEFELSVKMMKREIRERVAELEARDEPTEAAESDWVPITSRAEFELARKLGAKIETKSKYSDDWQRFYDPRIYWADHEYRARIPQ